MRLWFLTCLILFLSVLCPAKLRADITGDCRVDFADLYILMSEWMESEDCEMALGPELVLNWDFSAQGENWAGNIWDCNEDVAYYVNSEGSTGLLDQIFSEPISQGKTVQVSFDVESDLPAVPLPGQSCQVELISESEGSDQIVEITEEGHYSQEFTLSEDNYTTIRLRARGDNGVAQAVYIDNVSVRDVLPDGGFSLYILEEMV